jgi:signal transduction histidine kinase
MSSTLQQKNTRQLLIRLLVILVGGSLLFYYLMVRQARHMQKEQLELSQSNLRNAFNTPGMAMPLQIRGEYDFTEEKDIHPSGLSDEPRDTAIFLGTNLVSFRKLTVSFSSNGRRYLLTTYVSSKEIGHLIIKVFLIEAGLFVLLFIAIIYTNRRSSASLWAPFRRTLQQLGQYDITSNRAFELPEETGITEFNELNREIGHLLKKSYAAYHNQKQFVENASHEIQTPLAIIRSKLDLLISQPAITEETAILLADITEANERLSQMNKNLLLLAKIENNQFPDKKPIDLTSLLTRTIDSFRHYYQDEFPELSSDIKQGVTVTANSSLMDILFNNLIKNAVVHNVPSGYLHVQLNEHGLRISNSGPSVEASPDQFFERFRKGNNENKSTGLGLAIVKQICQIYGFTPQYQYANGQHTIAVLF